MERVDAGGLQSGYVFQPQAAADHDPRLVAGVSAPGRLGEQGGQAVVDARGRAGREVGVQAGQSVELLAQGVAVRGPVDGAVEGPAAAVQLPHDPLHGVQVDEAVGVEEPEHELLGPRGPHPPGGPDQPRDVLGVSGGESVRQPQHHAQVDVDGGPDPGEGLDRRGQPVGRHVGDQL